MCTSEAICTSSAGDCAYVMRLECACCRVPSLSGPYCLPFACNLHWPSLELRRSTLAQLYAAIAVWAYMHTCNLNIMLCFLCHTQGRAIKFVVSHVLTYAHKDNGTRRMTKSSKHQAALSSFSTSDPPISDGPHLMCMEGGRCMYMVMASLPDTCHWQIVEYVQMLQLANLARGPGVAYSDSADVPQDTCFVL